MIVGLTLDATQEHISKYDEQPENAGPDWKPTKWLIGSLDSRVLGQIQDMAMTVRVDTKALDDEVDTSVNSNQVAFKACQFGLRGWENFLDESGEEIPFRTVKEGLGGKKYSVVSSDVLCRVPASVLNELSAEITKRNSLTDEAGNA